MLKKVAEILDENSFSGLPVVGKHGKVVGIISETDVLRYTQQFIGLPLREVYKILALEKEVLHVAVRQRGIEVIEMIAATTVDKLMTRDVITINENAPIFQAIEIMNKHNVNRIPVVNKAGKLIGIITRADVIRVLVLRWKTINIE